MIIQILEDEYWYGGCVSDGVKEPYSMTTHSTVDLHSNQTPNQAMPLFLSSKGRYLWRDTGFLMEFKNGRILCPDDVEFGADFENLRGAYLAAMALHFPFHASRLSETLFKKPIYNTWIEMTFQQKQEDILEYAKNILNSGLPSGVLIIDDGWSDYYGKWKFNREKFPDAKQMIRKIHEMGFQVMVWVCPFITADTVEFRQVQKDGLLIQDHHGLPYITQWWNGFSAVLDFSKAATNRWFDEQLQALMDIGVDGFKFDAGDSLYYPQEKYAVSPNEHSRLWAAYGEKYTLNEYRATYSAGGYSLLQRLCDKEHSWGDKGLAAIIPDSLLQGLTGHPFCCPDMIGGGEYLNFQSIEKLDEELFIRHCQVACLMPAMQFSAAPYRVLSKEHFQQVKHAIAFREEMMEYLLKQVEHTKITGEPILRYMEYEFPNQNMAQITDQFMIGPDVLAAPIIEQGQREREVYIPKGKWTFESRMFISTGERKMFAPQDDGIIVLTKVL